MIKFRQKIFFWGAVAKGALMVLPGMGQSANQNKQQMEQQEEFARQQRVMQKKQNEALEKVAKAAQKDPSKAAQVQAVMGDKTFSIPLKLSSKAIRALAKGKGMLRRGGQTVFEFGKAINNAGAGNQIARKVGSGLAMGATMAAGTYAIDKAIQADRKRITGDAPLSQSQENSEKPGKKKNVAGKIIAGTALTAGTILAAKKGLLGRGFQGLYQKGTGALKTTAALKRGEKVATSELRNLASTRSALKTTGKELKAGLNGKAVLGGLGFAGVFTLPGYLGERKQLKEQAAAQQEQQKQYSEEETQPQEQKRKRGSVLGKAALGTLATVGTVAALRRVGPAGLRKGINDMYMTYGKKLAGKAGTGKVGNWIMNSGAKEYGKAQAKIAQKGLKSVIKAGAAGAEKAKSALASFNAAEYANKVGGSRLNLIKSGQHSRKLGQGLLNGVSKMWTGANGQQVNGFLNRMAKDTTNSASTRKAAEFLSKHKRTAAVGSIAVGSIAFKPFGWGEKAVRGATKAVDKNAFAYEKSKEQQVQ